MGWGMVRLFTLPSDIEANASKTTPTVAVTTVRAKPTVAKPSTKPPVKPVKPAATKLKVTLTGSKDGAYVTLRDYHGLKLFQGLLGPGSSQTVIYPGSIRVTLGIPDQHHPPNQRQTSRPQVQALPHHPHRHNPKNQEPAALAVSLLVGLSGGWFLWDGGSSHTRGDD